MKSVSIAVMAALLLIAFAPAQAWGVYGHQTIADIAERNASPATRAAVRRLLTAEAQLGTPTCPLRSLRDASIWADCVRGIRPRFEYTAPWHYQNVDVCKPFDLKSACANGNCAAAAIDRNLAILKDKSLPRAIRLEALAYLVHFVGDLHMPLHAGDRADRGGNDVKADYGIFTAPWLNLHAIWDTQLAERAISTPPSIDRGYTKEERAELSRGTTEDWSREGWALSRELAYARALDGDPCGPKPSGKVVIDEADVAASADALRLQIERAGLRLARLLDEALG